MRKMISFFLSTALLLPTLTLGASAQNTSQPQAQEPDTTAEVMRVYGGASGIVSMTFDDGIYDTAVWLNQMFEKYDLRGSCMMVTSKINETNIDDWKELFASGYLEPQNHSATHMIMPGTDWSGNAKYEASLPNNNDYNYQNEIYRSGVQLAMQFGSFPLCFAPSNNTLSREGTDYLKQYYYAMRKGQRWGSAGFQSLDPMPGSDEKGGWYNLFMMGFKGNESGSLISGLDTISTTGGWYITMCHGIGENEDSADSTYEKSEPVFQYMSELQKQGKIWVTTFGDAAKYIRERQNTKLSYTPKDGVYELTLTMAEKTADGLPLPLDVFNHPLTVKLSVPSGYDAVAYTVDGTTNYVIAREDKGGRYAYVDVVPNTGTVDVQFIKTNVTSISSYESATISASGYDPTTATISSLAPSKILIKIPTSDLQRIVDANINLQFGGFGDTSLTVYGVASENIETDNKQQLYNALLDDNARAELLYSNEPLATIPKREKAISFRVTEYLRSCTSEAWLLIESDVTPQYGIPLLSCDADLLLASDTVYYDPALIDLSHNLTIGDHLTYHVYWKQNTAIDRVTVIGQVYERDALAELPTTTRDGCVYTVLSIDTAPKDALTRLDFTMELSHGGGSRSVIEPSLSIGDYLHGLLAQNPTSDSLRTLILDLMLYIKASAELHQTDADMNIIKADIADYKPLLTDKLIGVTQKTLTCVESVSLEYGIEPAFIFTPGASHAASTYRFVWENGEEASVSTVGEGDERQLVVPFVRYCLLVPITIEEYDRTGTLLKSESYTAGNDFAVLKLKAREVAKYACAFSASLDAYRK